MGWVVRCRGIGLDTCGFKAWLTDGLPILRQLNHEQVAFQRRYVSYIKRCDELERKLRYIRGEINKFHMDTEVCWPRRSELQHAYN
jgi:hypothetical protein